MPTLDAARAQPIGPSRYRITPQPITSGPRSPLQPIGPIRFDPTPPHLTRSPVMISSLPYIATDTDNITRQFYNSKNLPTRRLIV